MHPQRRSKLIQIVLSVLFFALACAFLLWAMQDSMNAYMTPSEASTQAKIGKTIQLGGLVSEQSIYQDQQGCVHFVIQDDKASLLAHYCGLLPTLFREGQGVIAIGALDQQKELQATRLLAKHDEYYRPPGIASLESTS